MIDNHNDKVNHITQSFQWSEFRKTTGVKVIREDNFTLYLHQIPKLPFYIGYLPRPINIDNQIINKLSELGKNYRCIFIKVEPNLNQQYNNITIKQLKISKSILPQHTFFIDLTKTEEDLLKGMEPKTRYNIRVAQKHQVIIKEGTTGKDLEEFIKILEDTEKRQGFLSHPANYYRQLWHILRPANMVYLLLAYPSSKSHPELVSGSNNYQGMPKQVRHDNLYPTTPIASLMLFKFESVLYYPYGGSLAKSRNLMPNHLLHWEAIKLGKKLNCKTYDMWGAYQKKPDSDDSWFGIYRFKSGFGGKLITYPESFDLIINPFLCKLYQITDFLRWQIIRLRRLLH